MELPIPSKLQNLWDVWDIPTCLLLSLFLQVFLVLFAPFRQRSQNSLLHSLIWSAYLSADWIAAVTLGLITKVLTDDPFHPHHHVNRELYAFWSSFLLLHLGGPDTITSFALEDNEFWVRHLFGLILQVVGAAYCIFLTLPNNNLWLPTILVFVVGSVKYAERTMALYLASLDQFLHTVPEPEGTGFDLKLASESNHITLLMVSYSLLKSFKGDIFGNLCTIVINSSRMLFWRIENPNVGFKLIEYELSLLYEVLHTKVAAVRSRIGLVFRLSSFCFIVGAFISFLFVVNDGDHDNEFDGFEMSLTYALLIGAVGLDTISGIKLMIFSDWILVSNNGLIKRWRKLIPECVLKRRRWCGSVSQYNMIDYCLDERRIWKCKFPDCVRVMIDYIKFMLFSSSMDNIEDLKCFVFENKEIIGGRYTENDSTVFPYKLSDEFNYREEVLELHLATEIGYHGTHTESREYTEEGNRSRRICKVISDYMFYLLIMKPELLPGLSVVKGTKWQRTLQNTFVKAKGYMMKNKISDHIKACDKLIDYKVKEKDETQTVLSKACLNARKLKLRNENWKDLSHVWLRALKYGILRDRSPILNVAQASKGGELLTFILFLFCHLKKSVPG